MNHNTSFLLYPSGKTTYLRCRISYGQEYFTFNITQLDPDKWNKDTQRCRKNSMHGRHRNISAAVINHKIGEIESVVTEYANATAGKFNADALKILLHDKTGYPKHVDNAQKVSLIDAFTRYCVRESIDTAWTLSTYNKYNTARKDLLAFLTKAKNKDLPLPLLTAKMLAGFAAYLIEKDNCNETILKKFSHIKAFFRWADKNGYGPTQQEVYDYAPKLNTEEDDIVFLDEEEFKTLYEHDFSGVGQQHLDQIRDVFCFCCLTSLRYSDVAKLKRSNINKRIVSIGADKTHAALNINLAEKAIAILDKYKHLPDDHPLPVVSSQKSNDYIKDAARLCKISSPVRIVRWKGAIRTETFHPKHEVISFHASRRTFISIAIMNGVSPHTVMKFSGHKNYESMKPYINIADKARQEAIAIFDKI